MRSSVTLEVRLRRGRWRVREGWWALLLGLWLAGCAGPSGTAGAPELRLGGGRALLASAAVAGFSGLPAPPEESGRQGPLLGVVTARQRQAEGHRAIVEMWGVLAPVDAVGAEVEFSFWASG